MNISGTLNVFRLIKDPALCLPHYTASTFNQLPVPLSKAFSGEREKGVDIRAVILDKDNCFAKPHENEVWHAYNEKFQELRKAYPGSSLLIVSNTAGTLSDPNFAQADLLERNTGVSVLRHNTKKPGCRNEIMDYFRNAKDVDITSPSQIAVVGDRLFTDVMLANLMGARGVWIKDGIVENTSIFTRLEKALAGFLLKKGYNPPDPRSTFE
ncbi:HAD-superfamily phosphatase [Aulographum hederae CBS 113979]|uniref:HAD-superfamily phosphatase n=1 Tax=Aulographum hederae CBS 113979 TaxID=1176131 RepID=A0A6G1HA83_9PEZI|nr:HAD-superfamily phosphatase [Aulographum hederae CBS 113979]